MAIPAVVSGIITIWLLLAAHTDMNIPVVYDHDALYELTIFKGINEGNLPWWNPRLSAPFGGSDWRDFPLYQWIDYIAFRFLSLFTSNYAKLLNWYWILTIMATGATAAYGFLRLRAGPVAACCLAFLYATQPYVYARNITHFNLLCYLVPLMATACLEVAVGRWESGSLPAIREIPLYAWIAFLLQGISFFYLSFFGALLLFAAALYGACGRRTLRPLIQSAWLLVVLVAASVIGVSPTLVHWLQKGTDPAAVARTAAEAELNGLRIRHLLTPVPAHPLPLMRKLSDVAEAEHQDLTEATTTRLGLLGAIGFVALLAYILAVMAGWRLALDDGIVAACAALLFAALLWCTVGGFGSVFNTYVSPLIRAYDRIIVFIVFFILAAYGVLIPKILARKPWAKTHPVAVAMVLACITGIAFADALWIPHGIQAAEARGTAASDRVFVAQIERVLGGQGMVFQIPYTDVGSSGPGKIMVYDYARMYLQSTTNLKWSWGTRVGREEDRWIQSIARLPSGSLIAELEALGFRGLCIDTYGYSDNPSGMPAKAVAAIIGQKPLVSPDGRYLFFPLTSAHALPNLPSVTASAPFAPSEVHVGGSCFVDSINHYPAGSSAAVTRAVPFSLEGWMADTDTGSALPDVYAEIADRLGTRFYLRGIRYERRDVASHFNKPSLAQSGVEVSGSLSGMPPGSYQIRIAQIGPDTAEVCSTGLRLEVR